MTLDGDPELRDEAMRALYEQAHGLLLAGRDGEALEVLASLLNSFMDDAPERALDVVSDGLVLAAAAAYGVGDSSAAVKLYDEAIRRFGKRTEPALRSSVAMAMRGRARLLARSGRDEEALAAYREVLERFAEDESAVIAEEIARAREGIEAIGEGS